MANTTLIIFMITTIILLFSAMILSAVAATDATKSPDQCQEGCHKNSMWAALVTGIATAVIVIVMIVYIYTTRKSIAKAAAKHVNRLQTYLGKVQGVPKAMPA